MHHIEDDYKIEIYYETEYEKKEMLDFVEKNKNSISIVTQNGNERNQNYKIFSKKFFQQKNSEKIFKFFSAKRVCFF
jgi:hypothetical protein